MIIKWGIIITIIILAYIFTYNIGINNKHYKLKKINRIIFPLLISIAIIIPLVKVYYNYSIAYKYNWHYDYMKYSDLHKLSKGASQKIALIDTGISSFQNEDDKNNYVILGDKYDKDGHGTMLYSIIKGYNDDILGIAPSASVLSIKIMGDSGNIEPKNIAIAIKKAITENCTIINLSLGSYIFNQSVNDAVNDALSKGLTVIASSGDYSTNELLYPAAQRGVISVGSISENLKTSDFSNGKSNCIINAPGDKITCINNNKKVIKTSGTSQAASLISGYVALLKDYSSNNGISLSNDDIINILKNINNGTYDYKSGLVSLKN